MKLGLLLADTLDPDLRDRFTGFKELFENYFSTYVASSLKFRPYEVSREEFPIHLDECDAYVITGSKFGVYDNESWISQLLALVRDVFFKSDAKLVGICFGHQTIAQALGGEVCKSELGWTVGLQEYEIISRLPWMTEQRNCFQLLASHQDRVTQLPPQAINFARNEMSEFGGFYVGDRVLTLQAHPEFEPEILRHILENRRDSIGTKYEGAKESLSEPADKSFIGDLLRRFLDC